MFQQTFHAELIYRVGFRFNHLRHCPQHPLWQTHVSPICKDFLTKRASLYMLYSYEQLYIHIYMQKHIQHNKDERTEFFRKIYLSLYWKGCVWEVSWRLNRTATYWPPAPPAIAVRLFRSLVLLNWGPGGPASPLRAGSHSSIWNTDFKLWNPTAWLPVSPELYHCPTPTQFNPSTAKAISWSLRPDAPINYTGAFLLLTAWPGRRSICNIYISHILL